MSEGITPISDASGPGTHREIRCEAKLHGILDGDILEVRCSSRWCGKRPGVVVVHRFNIHTGEVETRLYKDPRTWKGNDNA